jgi:peptidoglycan-associated lipoprotein
MVISLFAFAACSSTGETDDAASGSQSSSAGSSGSSATSSAGSSSGRLSQEEIRAQNALRQTVFYFDFDIAEFKTRIGTR